MSKVLVKFKENYADEFDVYGFKILEKNKWNEKLEFAKDIFDKLDVRNKEKQKLSQAKMTGYRYHDTEQIEVYFGTNEQVMFSSYEDYLNAFTVIDIPDSDVEIFKLYFKPSFRDEIEFGQVLEVEEEPYDWEEE